MSWVCTTKFAPLTTNTSTLPFAIHVEPIAVVIRSIGAEVAAIELEDDDELDASELDIAEETEELDEMLELDELELGAIDDELDE